MLADDTESSDFIQYLAELRLRLIKVMLFFSGMFLLNFLYSDKLFHLISVPLLRYLPQDSLMVTTEITAPFIVPLKLALFSATILTIPVFFYQAWSFIAPALYAHEKMAIFPLTFISIGLFFVGLVFCHAVFFPLIFQVFISLVPREVKIMADISNYLQFVTRMLLIFGMTFQIPIIITALLKLQIVDLKFMQSNRSYFYVIALIIGMLLTPPDVISMLLLAIPMILLFELGIIFGKFLLKN